MNRGCNWPIVTLVYLVANATTLAAGHSSVQCVMMQSTRHFTLFEGLGSRLDMSGLGVHCCTLSSGKETNASSPSVVGPQRAACTVHSKPSGCSPASGSFHCKLAQSPSRLANPLLAATDDFHSLSQVTSSALPGKPKPSEFAKGCHDSFDVVPQDLNKILG